MTLGGRVAVMREGGIEQIAAPMDVYYKPANAFVAQFIGAPAMNFVSAAVLPSTDAPAGAVAGIRPQDVALGTIGPLRASVELVEPRGHDHLLHLRLHVTGSPRWLAIVTGAIPQAGAEVSLTLAVDRIHLFDVNGVALAPSP